MKNLAILGCLAALAFMTVTLYGDPAASGGGAGGGPNQASPTGPTVATPPGVPPTPAHPPIAPGTPAPNLPGSPAQTPAAGPNFTPPTGPAGGTNAAGTGIMP